MQFEVRTDNLALIRQVILKYCSCLIALGILRVENDQNNESQDKQLVPTEEEEQQQIEGNNDDEFIRITAAHQMLTEGKY